MRPDFIAPTTPVEAVSEAVPVPGSVAARVAELNARYRHHGATAVLERAHATVAVVPARS